MNFPNVGLIRGKFNLSDTLRFPSNLKMAHPIPHRQARSHTHIHTHACKGIHKHTHTHTYTHTHRDAGIAKSPLHHDHGRSARSTRQQPA
jgi:hypothetical protein